MAAGSSEHSGGLGGVEGGEVCGGIGPGGAVALEASGLRDLGDAQARHRRVQGDVQRGTIDGGSGAGWFGAGDEESEGDHRCSLSGRAVGSALCALDKPGQLYTGALPICPVEDL